MNNILRLKDVLLNSEDFEWFNALFLVKDEEWTLNSKCAVLDSDYVEDDLDEEPRFAIDNNLKYALNIQDIQSIVDNANQQHTGCTEDELFQAFLYYYDHDAFINFT